MGSPLDFFGGMSQGEVNIILSLLTPDDVMLEWGSGGSTVRFSKIVKKLYSIEHDAEWYVKNDIRIKQEGCENVNLHLIKPNLPRSFPHVKREEFVDYIEYVKHLPEKRYDKVLIDGRARIWCAYEALHYTNEDSFVFVHDWDRTAYHEILGEYNIFKQIDKLVVLTKKCV